MLPSGPGQSTTKSVFTPNFSHFGSILVNFETLPSTCSFAGVKWKYALFSLSPVKLCRAVSPSLTQKQQPRLVNSLVRVSFFWGGSGGDHKTRTDNKSSSRGEGVSKKKVAKLLTRPQGYRHVRRKFMHSAWWLKRFFSLRELDGKIVILVFDHVCQKKYKANPKRISNNCIAMTGRDKGLYFVPKVIQFYTKL